LLRIGQGFDSHRFESGRDLILGGVKIPHTHGLKGHSDGDVLTHAIIDSLLGAASLGDIGEHFPVGDPKYKDAHSLDLLTEVIEDLWKGDWRIVNIDCIIICEAPKLTSHKNTIEESLSKVLRLKARQLNIKAKTAERMGSLGREEGIAAWSTTLLAMD